MLNQSIPTIFSLGFALSSFGLLSLNANSAQAAQLTFDFTTGGSNNLSTIEVFDTTNTESVTVNGFKNFPSALSGNITRNASGYGIAGNPRGGQVGTNNNNQEALEFDFGEEVTLDSVAFTSNNFNASSFDLLIDGNLALDDVSLTSTIDVDLIGTLFTFTPSTNSSRFRIASLIANFDEDLESVPEPNFGITLITLGGLLTLSRFRLKTHYSRN
jgi:hypothetical protein